MYNTSDLDNWVYFFYMADSDLYSFSYQLSNLLFIHSFQHINSLRQFIQLIYHVSIKHIVVVTFYVIVDKKKWLPPLSPLLTPNERLHLGNLSH